ncbi:MAG: DUF4835 family protein [Prevotella sp.]|nr:DUF4835 family protein [Candidatus Prevotella equi]
MIMIVALSCMTQNLYAQELTAKVNINHSQIQGTEASVFDELKDKLEEFINQTQWTSLQYAEKERISCSFNITVSEYKREDGTWVGKCMIQANRPVYNSTYTTTIFQFQDNEFTFTFNQFDRIEFNPDMIDNQLTALFAYYAYLIIGIDLDTFAPKGGEDVLQRCMNLTNNAQNLEYPGWTSFDSSKNRFALINDYLSGAMEPFRELQYNYYRKGLDEMANNVERGRTEITTAITENLKKAHQDRPMSMLPQIWTDYKKDEIGNIYKGKGTSKEKDAVYDVCFSINPSQSNSWNKIKE